MSLIGVFAKHALQTFGKNKLNISRNVIRSIRNRVTKPDATISQIVPRVPSNQRDESLFAPADHNDLVDLARDLKPTYSFASYANESVTIQQFVKLGVDLSKLEKKKDQFEFILRLNFEKDVQPFIRFLHDNGVHADDLGEVLTKNIFICRESLDDLQTRVNYLESKNFDKDMIAAIINKNPTWLTTPVSVIDGRLGWFQKTFKMTGDDVRLMVNGRPQIVTFNINTIKLNMFVLEEEIGMSKGDMRYLLKTRPKLFTINQHKLLAAFEYVHKIMRIPIGIICRQPDILMQRKHRIKERHLFLESLGRAQYNPNLPGYISLDTFIKTSDLEFCTDLAKSSIMSYEAFLKTL